MFIINVGLMECLGIRYCISSVLVIIKKYLNSLFEGFQLITLSFYKAFLLNIIL